MPAVTPQFFPFHIKIDPQDEHLLAYKWFQSKQGFYTRIVKEKVGKEIKNKVLSLHREILGITGQTKLIVEFANGDRDDMRRSNLKVLSASQSQLKRTPGKGYSKLNNGRYIAQISINGQKKYLGCYETATEAEEVYQRERDGLLVLKLMRSLENLTVPVQTLDTYSPNQSVDL